MKSCYNILAMQSGMKSESEERGRGVVIALTCWDQLALALFQNKPENCGLKYQALPEVEFINHSPIEFTIYLQ